MRPVSDSDSPSVDRDRELALLWEQIAYEQEVAHDPDLTLEEYRERHESDLAAYRARRDTERWALEAARQATRRERAERLRDLVLAHPWATGKDLEQIELIIQASRPGETWVQFVERLEGLDEGYGRLLDAIFASDAPKSGRSRR